MRKLILFVLAAMATTQLGWAQGEGQDVCASHTSREDHSCNGTMTCGGTSAACESVTFQVPCDGTYDLSCQIIWNYGADPTNCKVYAVVCRVSDSGYIGHCEIQDEQSGEYTDNPHTSQINLQEHVDYKLIVCLDHCPGHTCDCTNCYALGIVRSQ